MDTVAEQVGWVEIPVGKAFVAKVDVADLQVVQELRWSTTCNGNCRYAISYSEWGTRKSVSMHRLIMEPAGKQFVDHINGDGLDNRRENLRICTRSQNNWNSRKFCNASSIYKGVHWCNEAKRWIAKIRVHGRRICGGNFRDEIEAAKCYDALALKHFGEFAKTNF